MLTNKKSKSISMNDYSMYMTTKYHYMEMQKNSQIINQFNRNKYGGSIMPDSLNILMKSGDVMQYYDKIIKLMDTMGIDNKKRQTLLLTIFIKVIKTDNFMKYSDKIIMMIDIIGIGEIMMLIKTMSLSINEQKTVKIALANLLNYEQIMKLIANLPKNEQYEFIQFIKDPILQTKLMNKQMINN